MVFGRGDRLEEEQGNDPCSEISIANQGYAGQADLVRCPGDPIHFKWLGYEILFDGDH